MVFEYPREQIGSLWIKDSDMPLDMVFCCELDGCQRRVEFRTYIGGLHCYVLAGQPGCGRECGDGSADWVAAGDQVELVPFIE